MSLADLFINIGIKTLGLGEIQTAISAVTAAGNAAVPAAKKFDSFFDVMKKRTKSFTDIATSFKKGQLIMGGLVASLMGLAKTASTVGAELTKFHNLTGLSTQKLQDLAQHAAASGVAFDDVVGSIEGLQKASNDIQLGRGNIAPWAMLGIDPNQDPFVVLTQLQNKLKTFSAARGTALAEELGLSRDMVNFLREANSVSSGDKTLLLSDKEIKRLKSFNVEFNRAWDSSKRALQKLALALMPMANGVMTVWNKIIFDINYAGKGIDALGVKFKAFWKIIGVIGAALAIYFFPITSALIGIGLVLEDFAAFSRGDDSVIGVLVNKFKQWKEILENIIPMIKYAAELLKEFALDKLESLKSFFGFGSSSGSGPQTSSTIGQVIPIGGVGAAASSSQTNNVNINVNGSSSPEEVAKRVQQKLKDVIGNTMYQQPLGATK